MADEYKTFKEWRAAGRAIIKGSKSIRRNENGVPLFHFKQTQVFMKHARNKFVNEGRDWPGDQDPLQNILAREQRRLNRWES